MSKVIADASSIDLDSLKDTLELATDAATKFQFKTSQGYVKNILTQAPGLKKALQVYQNTLVSVSEGLADKEITQKKAKADLAEANAALELAVQNFVASLGTKGDIFTPEDLLKDLNRETLKVYDNNMNQVQVQLNKSGIFTGYVPVLPLTQPALSVAKLKAAGIAADNFAGYPILKKEFVAGISRETLRKLISPEMGRKRKMSQEEHDRLAIEEFKSIIEAKYRKLKLVQVAPPAAWWQAIWIWYVTPSQYSLMKKCTLQATEAEGLKIKSWNFPFNRG